MPPPRSTACTEPIDPFAALIPRYDLILTYGGGDPVVSAYEQLGARRCVPIYNALDPSTHFPVRGGSRVSAAIWAFSEIDCPIARRGWTNFSSSRPRCCPIDVSHRGQRMA